MSTVTAAVPALIKGNTDQSSKSSSRASVSSPVPGGLGDVPTTLRSFSPVDKRVQGQEEEKEEAKRARTDENVVAPVVVVETPVPVLPPLPAVTARQREVLVSTYRLLATGAIARAAALPSDSSWNSWRTWVSFDWMQVKREGNTIQGQAPEIRGIVHPLSFLLLVKGDPTLQGYLCTVRGYAEAWNRIAASINRALVKIGQAGFPAPWDETLKDFSADMAKLNGGTLCLDTFLAEFPEGKRAELRGFVDTKDYAGLFNKVLG